MTALVMFSDAVAHVCRIKRGISIPRGNGLLVGVGGSGRQSLTRLAAYFAEYKVFTIGVSLAYHPTYSELEHRQSTSCLLSG